jgi:hypothetical protein
MDITHEIEASRLQQTVKKDVKIEETVLHRPLAVLKVVESIVSSPILHGQIDNQAI